MTVDRLLCHDCQGNLIRSGLVFQRLTDYDLTEDQRCAWCKRKRVLKRVRIQYGIKK